MTSANTECPAPQFSKVFVWMIPYRGVFHHRTPVRFNLEQVFLNSGPSEFEEVRHIWDAIAAVVVQNIAKLVMFLPILKVKNPIKTNIAKINKQNLSLVNMDED